MITGIVNTFAKHIQTKIYNYAHGQNVSTGSVGGPSVDNILVDNVHNDMRNNMRKYCKGSESKVVDDKLGHELKDAFNIVAVDNNLCLCCKSQMYDDDVMCTDCYEKSIDQLVSF